MNQISKAAALLGALGGAAGVGESKARSTEICRAAALAKWRNPEGVKQRFWAKVKKGGPDECWPWIGAKGSGGYGMLTLHGKRRQAHRVALELSGVVVDPDKDVCHHCDNPPCCNPKHVFQGTVRENMLDAYRKGRKVAKRGDDHSRHKLTSGQIPQIRKLLAEGFQIEKIARMFGVCGHAIYSIKIGRTWSHVT